jgi:hypothetical protein
MLQSDVDPMNEALRESYGSEHPTWDALQREWLYRLALLNNCVSWGYNLPGAFIEIETLLKLYPEAKVLFLFRSPDRVLASYKFMSDDHRDGHPDQYHPLAYAVYWRKSVEAYERLKASEANRVLAVHFESLIRDPQAALRAIGLFFGFETPEDVKPAEANSSFQSNPKSITGLEMRLLRVVAGRASTRLGYALSETPLRASDLLDFLATTIRFSIHQWRKFSSDGGLRRRILRFMR